MGDTNLVTTCNFHGQEYLFKLNVLNSNLEILVTDKSSGEEWQCSFDATCMSLDIENLTQKTGNYKQFDIFVAMIKSGLLKTSESVTLDLLTFDDLELLRSRKITKNVTAGSSNKRYLIVTYIVEFDKIRYPLPLEYCGPPDPVILQATIKRLEVELARTREELALKNNSNEARKVYYLQKRIDELSDENAQLREENRHLMRLLEKKSKTNVATLQKAVSNLERSVISERNSHHELVEKLRHDKSELTKQLEKTKCSEKSLKAKLNKLSDASRMGIGDHLSKMSTATKVSSNESIQTMYKRPTSPIPVNCPVPRTSMCQTNLNPKKSQLGWGLRNTRSKKHVGSRSSSGSSTNKYLDPEISYSNERRLRTPSPSPKTSRHINFKNCSCSSGESSKASSRTSSMSRRKKKLDYKKLEEKIESLQKLLTSNLMKDQ